MEQYIVEVTKRPEDAKGKQVDAVATTFNISIPKAQQLLQRLPGVVTKPVPARLANEIAERFQKAGMEAVVHEHAAQPPLKTVAKVAAPQAKLPEPDAFATAVDKMFAATPDNSPAEPHPAPKQRDFAPDFDTPDVSNSDFSSSDFSDSSFNSSDFNDEAQAAPPPQPNVAIGPISSESADLFEADYQEATANEGETGPVLSEVSARDAAKEPHPETAAEVTARGFTETAQDLPEEEAIDLEALESPNGKKSPKLLLPLFLLLIVAILVAWFFFI